MTSKKNGFWRFCFSFIPGAGEMYMGFMKMGISIMAVFFGIVALASWLEIGPMLLLAAIVWFYSFFHVHNLAALPPEKFMLVEDEYLFHMDDFKHVDTDSWKKYRSPIALGLIVVGVVLCYQSVYYMISGLLPGVLQELLDYLTINVPKLLLGIVIIYVGVRMIQGKKAEMEDEEIPYVEDKSAPFRWKNAENTSWDEGQKSAREASGEFSRAGEYTRKEENIFFGKDDFGHRETGNDFHTEDASQPYSPETSAERPSAADRDHAVSAPAPELRTVIYMPEREEVNQDGQKEQ